MRVSPGCVSSSGRLSGRAARIVHSEVNLRPALPDNLPHLDTHDGLTRINGLFRHGWLIAPALVEQALQEMNS